MKYQTILLTIALSSNVFAGEYINTTVINTGVNSKGQVFVTFAQPLIQEGCDSKTQLVLPADSIIKDQILSIALSAKATGTEVQIKPAGCNGSSPSLLSNYSPHGWFLSR